MKTSRPVMKNKILSYIEDFNIPLLPIDRTTKQNVNKDIELNNTFNQ